MRPLDLKARVREALRRHPSTTRGRVTARARAALVAGYGASILAFLAAGAVRVGPRPLPLVAGTALGAAAVAAIASWAAVGRGREMTGRSSRALAWVVIATPLGMLASHLAWDARFAPVAWHTVGLRCFGLMLLFGGGPLATLCFLRRGADPVHPRLLGAALGVAGGAFAGLLVDLWCPSSELSHLLVGHVGPFAVLALAGTWLGSRTLALRSPRPVHPRA